MVCMEPCSTRTMGRAACRGMFAWAAVAAAAGGWVLGEVVVVVVEAVEVEVEVDVRFRRGDCVKQVGCGLDGRAPGCYRATTHIEG